MAHVAISADFLTAYSRIPRAQQRRARDFITRFQRDPTAASINYEPVIGARDGRVRIARIDLAYRAVILHPEHGDVHVLAWVDHHDEAIEWATKKRFEVNPVSGALQVFDTELADGSSISEAQPVERIPLKSRNDPGLFDPLQDHELLRVGLPRLLVPAVRALRTCAELDELGPHLPDEAYEALFWISNLGYSVDQALAEVSSGPSTRHINPDDISAALECPDSKRRFVVVQTANDLEAMLDAPLEKWRVFLHPTQASLVQRQFSGPARVLGGAGTGKTVVAMHRARFLASQVFTHGTDRILFTTYTKNLAMNIRENLRNLCGSEFERIEVVHLHSWAASLLASQGFRFGVANETELSECWQKAISAFGAGEWDEEFYREEWEHVVWAQGLADSESYLAAPRTGQRVRLTRAQRAAVWGVFDKYKQNLATRNRIEWLDVIHQARLHRARSSDVLPYRAVVVDETQDMHPEELRLIREIVAEGSNDLFLVGDAHQRIFGRPIVLSHCGIKTRGRSSKLRINYRTTEEIRDWSVAVLSNKSDDDLDGGPDPNSDYRSLLHGGRPIVKHFASLAEETGFVVGRVNELLASGASADGICLVARHTQQLTENYGPALVHAGIPILLLKAGIPDGPGPEVRLATMHRVKGLEFQHVLIAGVNDGVVPPVSTRKATIDADEPDSEIRERCLLHVAASRARDTLTVTSYGVASRFLTTDTSSHDSI